MSHGMIRTTIFMAVAVIGAGFVAYRLTQNSPSTPKDHQSASLVASNTPLPQDTAPQCGEDLPIEAQDFPALYQLGQRVGVGYAATFARVVDHLHDEDQLPSCYLTKIQARDQGWQRGTTLDKAAVGFSIGGDYFGNREGLLPRQYNGDYREADLDYVSGGRGAVRLVYVHGQADLGLIWVTTDHYDSFTRIYCNRQVCDQPGE